MGMRVTTGMAMNLYRYNLQNSTIKMNDSRNMVLTGRKFNSYGEAPAAATQAWRLRRSLVNADIYQSNNKDTYTRFNIAWLTLGQASYDLTNLDGQSSAIYAANDPTGAGRNALGTVLRQTAESVIQTMNSAKSGEHFLFSGDDELNAPFTWGPDMWGNETLLYRGVDVNSGKVQNPGEDPMPDRWGEIDEETGRPALMPREKDRLGLADQMWHDYYTAKAEYGEVHKAYEAYEDARKNFVAAQETGAAQGDEEYDAAEEAYNEARKAYEAIMAEYDPEYALPPEPDDVTTAADEPEDQSKALYPPDSDPFKDTPDEGKDDYGIPKAAYAIKYDQEEKIWKNADGEPATDQEIAWATYYVDQGNVAKLKRMSAEEVPVDLGMGMLEDVNGKLVDGTYYNRALPGINMLGYGFDADGDPLNVCMVMRRLAEIYESCDSEDGTYASDADREEAMRLVNKLKAAQSYVSGQYVDVGAKSSFLEQNQDRLELQASYLTEQLLDIEDVDPADAISQFSWDYYCYSAALKVGTQLLSQSLIDYMS